MAKVSAITLATMTCDSNMLVLSLATLGSTTEIGSFLFVVVLPKLAKASTVVTVTRLLRDCHASLSLTVLLINFANVNDHLSDRLFCLLTDFVSQLKVGFR